MTSPIRRLGEDTSLWSDVRSIGPTPIECAHTRDTACGSGLADLAQV